MRFQSWEMHLCHIRSPFVTVEFVQGVFVSSHILFIIIVIVVIVIVVVIIILSLLSFFF